MYKNITIPSFLIGMACGAIGFFLVIVLCYALDPQKGVLRNAKTFCNMELQPCEISDDGQEAVKSLAFLLDSKPFMYIYGYRNGRVRDMVMVDSRRGPMACVLSVEAADRPGEWHNLCYGNDDPNDRSYHAGLLYEDIDYDGYFDIKHIRDDKGNIKHIFIDFRGVWLEVNSVDAEKGVAQREDLSYIFGPDTGWNEVIP